MGSDSAQARGGNTLDDTTALNNQKARILRQVQDAHREQVMFRLI